MASMMLGDAEALRAEFAEKGRLSCCDPCCGSGLMLLAGARVIHDTLGPAYLRLVDLYGQDIDLRCVLMTRPQPG